LNFLCYVIIIIYFDYYYSEIRVTPQGQVFYFHVPSGRSSWYHPCVPKNTPSIADAPLPQGWEQRATSNSKSYFVDHNTKTTHFTDPRLVEQFSSQASKTTALIQAADPLPQTSTDPSTNGGFVSSNQASNAANPQAPTTAREGDVQRAEPQHNSKPVKCTKIPTEKKIEKIDIMVKLKQLRIQVIFFNIH